MRRKKICAFIFVICCIGFRVTAQTFHSVILTTNSPIAVPAGETWELMSAESSNNYLTSYELYTPNLRIQIGSTVTEYAVAPTKGATGAVSSGNIFVANETLKTWVWSGDAGTLPVSGPATITITHQTTSLVPTCLLSYRKFTSDLSRSTVSSTSVVIPQSATGDVDVKMEQSADNVTWTECLPGTYNSSTVKRFFRLRAVEK